jgi:hypothetical protein
MDWARRLAIITPLYIHSKLMLKFANAENDYFKELPEHIDYYVSAMKKVDNVEPKIYNAIKHYVESVKKKLSSKKKISSTEFVRNLRDNEMYKLKMELEDIFNSIVVRVQKLAQ